MQEEQRPKSKVYILLDAQNRIIQCEGGYTLSNVEDFSQWVQVDEGYGDRYNLCQTHYFDGGLTTEEGICRWKYENGQYFPRTDEEIASDRLNPPAPYDELTDATDALILLGVSQ